MLQLRQYSLLPAIKYWPESLIHIHTISHHNSIEDLYAFPSFVKHVQDSLFGIYVQISRIMCPSISVTSSRFSVTHLGLRSSFDAGSIVLGIKLQSRLLLIPHHCTCSSKHGSRVETELVQWSMSSARVVVRTVINERQNLLCQEPRMLVPWGSHAARADPVPCPWSKLRSSFLRNLLSNCFPLVGSRASDHREYLETASTGRQICEIVLAIGPNRMDVHC